MPGLIGVAVPLILSIMMCVLLAGKRLSAVRLSVSVVLSQFLFHTLFVLGSISPTGLQSDPHAHHGILILPSLVASSAGPDSVSLASSGSGMWAGHLLSAAVTIVALYQGERIARGLRRLAAQLSTWLVALLRRAAPPAPVSTRRILRFKARLWDHDETSLVVVRRRRRRGPPRLSII